MIAVMQRIPLVRTLLPVVTMAAMIKTEFFLFTEQVGFIDWGPYFLRF